MTRDAMTPRSLVGMTMGARKRAWLAGRIDAIVFPDGINTDELEMKSAYSWPEIRRWWQPFGWQLLGQRLRPCPGEYQCKNCSQNNWCRCTDTEADAECVICGVLQHWPCDGSGVLPAQAKKVRR